VARNDGGDPTITFRIPEGLKREMEEEMELSGRNNNISEFIKDAIKYYIDFRISQRIEGAKVKTVITKTGDL
jgi:hypothetical protein